MICPDCKGKGSISLLMSVAPCMLCGGTGKCSEVLTLFEAKGAPIREGKRTGERMVAPFIPQCSVDPWSAHYGGRLVQPPMPPARPSAQVWLPSFMSMSQTFLDYVASKPSILDAFEDTQAGHFEISLISKEVYENHHTKFGGFDKDTFQELASLSSFGQLYRVGIGAAFHRPELLAPRSRIGKAMSAEFPSTFFGGREVEFFAYTIDFKSYNLYSWPSRLVLAAACLHVIVPAGDPLSIGFPDRILSL